MKLFLAYFLIFFTYSVLGWVVESLFVSIKNQKFINRGFLIGPYCPIYGYGAIIMILYLTQYKDNIITVFLLSIVICSILEYFTSYMMEKLFKARWWDYSDRKLNLNGRVCGENSLLFGIGGVIIIYLVHPALMKVLKLINDKLLLILVIIFLIIYVTDTIISFNIVNKFKKTVTSLNLRKDSTGDFSKVVRETIINNHKIFQKRLYNAFPNMDIKKYLNINLDGEIKKVRKRLKDETSKFKENTKEIKKNMKKK